MQQAKSSQASKRRQHGQLLICRFAYPTPSCSLDIQATGMDLAASSNNGNPGLRCFIRRLHSRSYSEHRNPEQCRRCMTSMHELA